MSGWWINPCEKTMWKILFEGRGIQQTTKQLLCIVSHGSNIVKALVTCYYCMQWYTVCSYTIGTRAWRYWRLTLCIIASKNIALSCIIAQLKIFWDLKKGAEMMNQLAFFYPLSSIIVHQREFCCVNNCYFVAIWVIFIAIFFKFWYAK